METSFFSPVILAACGILAYAMTKAYDAFNEWYENRKRLSNDIFRFKCRKIKEKGKLYYMDLIKQDPERLANHLSRLRTIELIKNNKIENLYEVLRNEY